MVRYDMLTADVLKRILCDYDSEKYPEEFYTYYSEVLRSAVAVDESVRQAVKYLFFWKLGKVSIRRTPHSSPLEFCDSQGRQFYSTPTTRGNEEAVAKAIELSRLGKALEFRDGKSTYDTFKQYATDLTKWSIVLPAFYVHIWRPPEYPILDVNVWKAFLVETGHVVRRNTKPRSWLHYESYTVFFRGLVDSTGLSWRTIDRALWALGSNPKRGLTSDEAEPISTMECSPIAPGVCAVSLETPPVPADLLHKMCAEIAEKVNSIPFTHRGIRITTALVSAAVEALNAAPNGTLAQNCRNDARAKTPDGLDRRMKDLLATDLRTANIVSDVLMAAGIVEILLVQNPRSRRLVKGTRLLPDWRW
jgi:hypothetical protein